MRRTRIGPFAVENADLDRLIPLDEALAFLPAMTLDADAGRRAGHGQAVPGEASGVVRLVDDDGLVALAEPRDGGRLKPIVGFRG